MEFTEEQQALFVQMLISDYKRLVSGDFEYSYRLYDGYKTMFKFYLTEQEQSDMITYTNQYSK